MSRKKRQTPELLAQVQALRAEGLGYRRISQQTGIPESSVYYWLNPDRRWGVGDKAGRHRNAHLKRFYGISEDEYNARLEAQGGGCAICGRLPGNCQYGILYVDHDHWCCPGQFSCGKCIRGLLCNDCNSGIGRFCDDPRLLKAATEYVERTGLRDPSPVWLDPEVVRRPLAPKTAA